MEKREKGQSLIEFAFTLPIFLTVFLGAMQLAFLSFQLHGLYLAVNRAARIVVTQGSAANAKDDIKKDFQKILSAYNIKNVDYCVIDPAEANPAHRNLPFTVILKMPLLIDFANAHNVTPFQELTVRASGFRNSLNELENVPAASTVPTNCRFTHISI